MIAQNMNMVEIDLSGMIGYNYQYCSEYIVLFDPPVQKVIDALKLENVFVFVFLTKVADCQFPKSDRLVKPVSLIEFDPKEWARIANEFVVRSLIAR